MKVGIAGASGTLGRELVRAFADKNHEVVAFVRNEKKIGEIKDKIHELRIVDITKPETLKGKMDDCELIVSSVGITRQKDKVTFMDIDYQANVNILREAESAGCKKFVYVSVAGVDKESGHHIPILAAKHKFEQELFQCKIPHLSVRPTGFYSDLMEIFNMAKRGTIYTFADPKIAFTPIHPLDLAEIITEKHTEEGVIEVGGPDHLDFYQVGEICSRVLGKKIKVKPVPKFMLNIVGGLIRIFSKRVADLLLFFRFQGENGDEAQKLGKRKLEDYFKENA